MKTHKQNGWEVPDGYKIVPVKVTPEMQDAMASAIINGGTGETALSLAVEAAPQPPAKPEVSAEPIGFIGDFCAKNLKSRLGGQILPPHERNSVFYIPLYAAPPDAQAIRDTALEEAALWAEARGSFSLANCFRSWKGGAA